MTHLLEKVVGNLNKLSALEKDVLAGLLQQEMLWDISLKNSENELFKLTRQARAEHMQCKTPQCR